MTTSSKLVSETLRYLRTAATMIKSTITIITSLSFACVPVSCVDDATFLDFQKQVLHPEQPIRRFRILLTLLNVSCRVFCNSSVCSYNTGQGLYLELSNNTRTFTSKWDIFTVHNPPA